MVTFPSPGTWPPALVLGKQSVVAGVPAGHSAVRVRTHGCEENACSDREKHRAQQQKAQLAPGGSKVPHRQLHLPGVTDGP